MRLLRSLCLPFNRLRRNPNHPCGNERACPKSQRKGPALIKKVSATTVSLARKGPARHFSGKQSGDHAVSEKVRNTEEDGAFRNPVIRPRVFSSGQLDHAADFTKQKGGGLPSSAVGGRRGSVVTPSAPPRSRACRDR